MNGKIKIISILSILVLCLSIIKNSEVKFAPSISPTQPIASVPTIQDKGIKIKSIDLQEKINNWNDTNTINLPPLDHESLITKAIELEKNGIFRFATSRNVSIKPRKNGSWINRENTSTWEFKIKS